MAKSQIIDLKRNASVNVFCLTSIVFLLTVFFSQLLYFQRNHNELFQLLNLILYISKYYVFTAIFFLYFLLFYWLVFINIPRSLCRYSCRFAFVKYGQLQYTAAAAAASRFSRVRLCVTP